MDGNAAADRFLAIADRRMIDNAIAELRSSFADAESEVVCADGSIGVMGVKSEKMAGMPIDRISKTLTFSYMVFHEWAIIESPYDKDRIASSITDLLNGRINPTFMIEAKVVEANVGTNAKSIEVEIGMMVEENGFSASLTAPDLHIFLIVSATRTAIGYSGVLDYPGPMDPFRVANANPENELNRAELKFREAVDFFDIDIMKWHTAIDVGAAPGGWTAALSRMMCRVVAVDSAVLDYDNLYARKTLVLYSGNSDDLEKYKGKRGIDLVDFSGITKPLSAYLEEYDVVHLKANMGSPTKNFDDYLLQLKDVDAVVIDSNMDPEKNAEMAVRLSGTMKRNGALLMAIKLMDNDVQKHMDDAKAALSGSFGGIRVKKLHYNRMELSLMAVKA